MRVCCSMHTALYLFAITIHKQLKAEGIEGREYKGSHSFDVCIDVQCCQADECDPQQCSGTCKAAELRIVPKDVEGMWTCVTSDLTGTNVAGQCHKISTSCSVSVYSNISSLSHAGHADSLQRCWQHELQCEQPDEIPSCACGWKHCFENRLYTGSRQSSKRVEPT